MIPLDIQPHEILGISKSASVTEAQRAFKTLAKVIHPDMVLDNQAGATVLFKLINFALDGMKSGGKWPNTPNSVSKIFDPYLYGWIKNAKGNWVLHKPNKVRFTVYMKGMVWRWICNDEFDNPMFSDTVFSTSLEGIEDVMNRFTLWS